MGPINGKQSPSESESYLQTQIDLFKWRANSAYNSHIARVSFSSLQSLLHRQKLQSLLADRNRKQTYIEFAQILRLAKDGPIDRVADQIMVFEDYIGDLTLLAECLTLEESLYTLDILLRGYQTIFEKIGRTLVALECCFLTVDGEVRSWINSNFMTNDLPPPNEKNTDNEGQHTQLQLTQVGVIRQVLKISEYLPSNRSQYHHFVRELRQFMEKDILHHFNFAAVRKFINGYIYNYGLTLPSNLISATKRHKTSHEPSPPVSSSRMASSLAEYIQNGDTASKGRAGNLSTGANLEMLSRIQQQSGNPRDSPSLSSYSSKSKFEYYTPKTANKPFHGKKFSTTQPRNNRQQPQKHLSKSTMVANKQKSDKHTHTSVSNSFSKKQQNYYQEQNQPPTHKSNINRESIIKKDCNFNSSTILSQMTHSKEQNRFNNSKVYQDNPGRPDQFGQPLQNFKLQHKHSNPYEHTGLNKRQQKDDKEYQINLSKPHIQEVSLESNQSAIFGPSPPVEFVNYPLINKLSYSMYPLQNSNGQQSLRMGETTKTPFSTKIDRSPSMHRQRQVSGLIFNSALSIHESIGSLASMQNSRQSNYDGVLTQMGHSAELVHIPTAKCISHLNKSVSNTAFLTF